MRLGVACSEDAGGKRRRKVHFDAVFKVLLLLCISRCQSAATAVFGRSEEQRQFEVHTCILVHDVGDIFRLSAWTCMSSRPVLESDTFSLKP